MAVADYERGVDVNRNQQVTTQADAPRAAVQQQTPCLFLELGLGNLKEISLPSINYITLLTGKGVAINIISGSFILSWFLERIIATSLILDSIRPSREGFLRDDRV